MGPRDVTAAVPQDRVVSVSPRFPYGPLRIDAIETPHAKIGHYRGLEQSMVAGALPAGTNDDDGACRRRSA